MNVTIISPRPAEIAGECRRIKNDWSRTERCRRRQVAEHRQQELWHALRFGLSGPRPAGRVFGAQILPSAMRPAS